MMLTVIMVVIALVSTVSAAFGLEGSTHPDKIRSEAMEHVLDHMVGPNAKNLVSNFSRQMPITQMPGKAHQLNGVFMCDLDNKLGSGLHPQPLPIFKLQAISIGHRNRFRKVEKDTFTLIRGQANAAAMALVKIEGDSACRLFLRPVPRGAIN
jgi:hypothetical protein